MDISRVSDSQLYILERRDWQCHPASFCGYWLLQCGLALHGMFRNIHMNVFRDIHVEKSLLVKFLVSLIVWWMTVYECLYACFYSLYNDSCMFTSLKRHFLFQTIPSLLSQLESNVRMVFYVCVWMIRVHIIHMSYSMTYSILSCRHPATVIVLQTSSSST